MGAPPLVKAFFNILEILFLESYYAATSCQLVGLPACTARKLAACGYVDFGTDLKFRQSTSIYFNLLRSR